MCLSTVTALRHKTVVSYLCSQYVLNYKLGTFNNQHRGHTIVAIATGKIHEICKL